MTEIPRNNPPLKKMHPTKTIEDLLGEATSLRDPEEPVQALLALLPHATAAGVPHPQRFVQDVSNLVLGMPDPGRRASTLIQLAQQLPDQQARRLYEMALDDVGTLLQEAQGPDGDGDIWPLLTVVAALPADLKRPLIALAQQLPDDPDRVRWMPDSTIMAEPTGETGPATLLAPTWGRRARFLAALAAGCATALIVDIAAMAQRIDDTSVLCRTMLALYKQLPPDQTTGL